MKAPVLGACIGSKGIFAAHIRRTPSHANTATAGCALQAGDFTETSPGPRIYSSRRDEHRLQMWITITKLKNLYWGHNTCVNPRRSYTSFIGTHMYICIYIDMAVSMTRGPQHRPYYTAKIRLQYFL